jgi:hypothetical protein
MAAGEYAVHPSTAEDPSAAPVCYVFPTLENAQLYSEQQAAIHPAVRFRIYDHNGFIGAPVREIRGMEYRDRNEISPRFRRWVGSILFFGGLILTIADWSVDFRFLWPSMLGTRMLMPGAMLLFIEAMIMLHAYRTRAQNGPHLT